MKRIKLLPFSINTVVALGAGGAVYFNAAAIDCVLPDFLGAFAQSSGLAGGTTYKNLTGLLTLVLGAILPSGAYGWFRRVRTTGRVEIG